MSAPPKWTGGRWELGVLDSGWFIIGDVEIVEEPDGEVRHKGTLICASEMRNEHDGHLLLVSNEMYKELVGAVARCPSPGCEHCLRIDSLLRRARGEREDAPPESGDVM